MTLSNFTDIIADHVSKTTHAKTKLLVLNINILIRLLTDQKQSKDDVCEHQLIYLKPQGQRLVYVLILNTNLINNVVKMMFTIPLKFRTMYIRELYGEIEQRLS